MPDVRLIDANTLPMYKVKIVHSFGIVEGSVVFPDDIKKAPTIDAVPVVHGRWVWTSFGWCCSVCNKKSMVEAVAFAKYCNRCGAKMDANYMDASTKDEEE